LDYTNSIHGQWTKGIEMMRIALRFSANPDRCSGRVDQILSATDESEPGVELVLDAIQLVGTNTELTS
jgi:hypothetical protein